MDKGGQAAVETREQELERKLDSLRVYVSEEDPEPMGLDYYIPYAETMHRHGLHKTANGQEYLQLLLDNAERWAQRWGLSGRMCITEMPRSHWWWYLPEIGAGRMPRPVL